MARDGTAVIRASSRVGHEPADQGEPWPWEIALNRFGHNKYDFTLEVRVPGQEPFSVTDRFKVPIRVDGRGRIEIDWDAWMASPGRNQAMRAGRATDAAAGMRAHLDKNPKLRDKVRANNRRAALAWAEAVRLGSLTREEFEQQLTSEVEHGRMDLADAEAARATLDDT